jgi:hypothetical protein
MIMVATAGDLPIYRGRQSHVEELEQDLRGREKTNESARLDPKKFEVLRYYREA